MSGLKKRLIESFGDQEYARAYMESHVRDKLAAQIYQTRLARGWTQAELAERSGIAQARISKIEAGDFDSLTMATLRKFADAFDVTVRAELQPFSYGVHDVCHWLDKKVAVPARHESLGEFAQAVASIAHMYTVEPTIISTPSAGVASMAVTQSPMRVRQPQIFGNDEEFMLPA